jgi:hypothetical protein
VLPGDKARDLSEQGINFAAGDVRIQAGDVDAHGRGKQAHNRVKRWFRAEGVLGPAKDKHWPSDPRGCPLDLACFVLVRDRHRARRGGRTRADTASPVEPLSKRRVVGSARPQGGDHVQLARKGGANPIVGNVSATGVTRLEKHKGAHVLRMAIAKEHRRAETHQIADDDQLGQVGGLDDRRYVLAPALERRPLPGLRGVRQPDASPVEHGKATEPSESVEKSGTDGVVEPRFHRSGPTRDQDDIVRLRRVATNQAVGNMRARAVRVPHLTRSRRNV